jgi:hypothetical protein
MELFHDLGSRIEQRWKDHNYDEAVFPALAAEALAEASLDKLVSPWDIVRWLNSTTELPSQQDVPGNFGNPPITLFSGPRFHIDIYFWLDGTTSIHQHGFCGAFQVLMGSSIHSQYNFHPKQVLNQHFAVGDIRLESVELLEQGQIKPILSGKAYIHSLFHLDRPSATICVRTYHTASGSPQYNFLKPSFATDPFFKEPLSLKQLQSASLLLSMQHPDAVEMLDDLLSRADFQTTFALLDLAKSHLGGNRLEQTFGLSTGDEQYQRLFETARRRHGELADLIPPVFEEARRQNNLIHRRAQITAPEHRFFLALLLNVPDRRRMLEMAARRAPEADPVDTVMEWVEELANTKMLGSSEANVLGIADFDDDYQFALRCLLEGLSLTEARERCRAEWAEDYADEIGAKLDALYESIPASDLFRGLQLGRADAAGSTP